MFKNLAQSLGRIAENLKSKGFLTGEDIDKSMRDIRIAFLEADVALSVVKEITNTIKEKASGAEIIKSVTPGQMLVKIVQDELTELLGSNKAELKLTSFPSVIMTVGLQGSGKTTSSAKLAYLLTKKMNKKVMLASLDIARPAAQEQLKVLADKHGISSFPIQANLSPLEIAKAALRDAKEGNFDVLILDSAGRLHIDNELMSELAEIKKVTSPNETLLVADSLTGQDAVNIAKTFNEAIGITGIILTRLDADHRGGSALTMKFVTKIPIIFAGIGEKIDDFEEFNPDRIASKILDMGDIVSLVERASTSINEQEAEKMSIKLQKGVFDLNDLLKQLRMIKSMGGVSSLFQFIPGIGKLSGQIEQMNPEQVFRRQEAIILSMTKKERKFPKLLNGPRKRRVALGSGVEVSEINKLLKNFDQMSHMIKKMSKMDKKSMFRGGMNKFFS